MLARILEFVLQAADSGLIPGRLQKLLWRRWYQTLNLRWEDDAWTFMNYGYVSDDCETDRPLAAEDEDHRLFIALYDQALPSIPLTDLRVLEVGAGRDIRLDVPPCATRRCVTGRRVHLGPERPGNDRHGPHDERQVGDSQLSPRQVGSPGPPSLIDTPPR